MSSAIPTTGSDPVIPQPSRNGFHSFENAAADAVLAISYNSSGKRLATASADHKVRIYDNGDQNTDTQAALIDQWRAHDAEILDVSWSKTIPWISSNCGRCTCPFPKRERKTNPHHPANVRKPPI